MPQYIGFNHYSNKSVTKLTMEEVEKWAHDVLTSNPQCKSVLIGTVTHRVERAGPPFRCIEVTEEAPTPKPQHEHRPNGGFSYSHGDETDLTPGEQAIAKELGM